MLLSSGGEDSGLPIFKNVIYYVHMLITGAVLKKV